MNAIDALRQLRDGNRRFADDRRLHRMDEEARRRQLTDGQAPFAIILGCSDSRAPAEIVFDQGLGDLFVIRVAGNIVQPSQAGSVEYAASTFGTRLVVILGHTSCGAVSATLEQLRSQGDKCSPNLQSIVGFIRPSVEPLLAQDLDAEALLRESVRANVRASVAKLRLASPVLERLERDEGLVIVGAEYSLETGLVDFFDGVPGGA